MEDRLFSLFQKRGVRRVLIFVLLTLILYFLRSMMDLMLLTFIFSYLVNRLQKIVTRWFPIKRRLAVLIVYILILGGLTFGVIKYFPILVNEITQLVVQISDFYTKPQHNEVLNYIVKNIQEKKIVDYAQKGVSILLDYFTSISKVSIQVFMAIILSLFFLLEKERIIRFTKQFKTSKLAAFYDEIEYFGVKFVGTFGKVIEAQFIIAVVNSVLTTIGLWILGFPQLFGLAILIFALGLIPVAGVFISLIPLCIIAYSIGGGMKVLYVLILIVIVHAVEAYVLNPQLMSSKTNMPVFYTFLILIFCEHFFGLWGLILGIPIVMFFLDVLEVTGQSTEPKKKT
ncbi:AI-2E family transporter [Weizmannia coagulans]|uniref:Membrane protein n=2 Tax=Heyndrickxia TaxID=2837504 RepID=A0AAN0T7W9_HEYCO|nr:MULTISPECIES: AI-2E family transporter [Heyndrickxia]AJO24487.1 membrane protein [Heyndrickxia coagulans]AKN54049.1 membrane protein, putative [Heyndrickxia coagulans]ATW84299.1 AI-2E family transporter [Heyndrickxia coagulans]KGB30394.1 membrane protein [Heyndrickxia coagulans]KXT19353.1 membrane protein [Heyndrickxia coagulans]